ncbi:MAG TPA: MFS transporter [Kineosporiaceae bacterium]|nr:MFS transporter [Kineosporiaceae bacterium]
MTGSAVGVLEPGARRREQRSWYFYDWANSAYVTTTLTVLLGPYLTSIAEQAACPGIASDAVCRTNLSVLGIPVSPGSLALYAVTVTTLISALLLPVVGALVDRTGRKRTFLGGFAWVGAAAASAMWFVSGDGWVLGVVLQMVASLALGCSLVVYDAILIDIATPDERDGVSSRGWAVGYLGGGLLLALDLVVVQAHASFGLSEGAAVRLSLLSAGLWWGAFTLIPYLGLRDRPPGDVVPEPGRGLVGAAFAQLATTLRDLRGYPQTLRFLVAYLFFNDGIQTVIVAASIFASEQLGLPQGQLITSILVVQFVAFGGALIFGRIAGRTGAQRAILGGLVLWVAVVAVGFVLPAHRFGLFLALAVLIGVVLGGTQALARSLYSQLVPRGREAEYFSLYQSAERGTSWSGTLLFGLVFQLTHTYRAAIVALVVFFVVGGVLLARVDVRRGVVEAGNDLPAVV